MLLSLLEPERVADIHETIKTDSSERGSAKRSRLYQTFGAFLDKIMFMNDEHDVQILDMS